MTDREHKVYSAAIQAAQEALSTLPDDATFFKGTTKMTGKEVKQKFECDDDFAAETVKSVVKLKFRQARQARKK